MQASVRQCVALAIFSVASFVACGGEDAEGVLGPSGIGSGPAAPKCESTTGACQLECSGDGPCVADCGASQQCIVTCKGRGDCECRGSTCQLDCQNEGRCQCKASICTVIRPPACTTLPFVEPGDQEQVRCPKEGPCTIKCPPGKACGAQPDLRQATATVDATEASFARIIVFGPAVRVLCPKNGPCLVSSVRGGAVDVECSPENGDCAVSCNDLTSCKVHCSGTGLCLVAPETTPLELACTRATRPCYVACDPNQAGCNCTGNNCRSCGKP